MLGEKICLIQAYADFFEKYGHINCKKAFMDSEMNVWVMALKTTIYMQCKKVEPIISYLKYTAIIVSSLLIVGILTGNIKIKPSVRNNRFFVNQEEQNRDHFGWTSGKSKKH